MRVVAGILVVALLFATVILFSNRQKLTADVERQRELLRVRSAELDDARLKLSNCSSQLHLSTISVDELRRRGNVIATADAWLDLVCVPAPDGTFDPNAPVALSTAIRLVTPSGAYTLV